MKRPTLLTVLAACLCIATTIATADDVLKVHATEASTQISPRDPGQQQTALPSLDIGVVAVIGCVDGATAEAMTVSVADTSIRFSRAEISEADTVNATLRLPANQIAPISAASFCVRGESSEVTELLLPGVASAQISLLCLSETTSSMHFASVALPLRLHCVADENQNYSPDK
jgi:hypothetical protein